MELVQAIPVLKKGAYWAIRNWRDPQVLHGIGQDHCGNPGSVSPADSPWAPPSIRGQTLDMGNRRDSRTGTPLAFSILYVDMSGVTAFKAP